MADTRRAGERLLVGIDRLDYTRGIPRRLLAYERMFTHPPELRGHVRLAQVAVPSRTSVDAYAGFRQQVDGLVGRINGRFGTATWAPVHYVYRGLSEVEVSALYRAADVLLVTPIRDGMNLVAKEFVAARSDGGGVLVLSEFAGAASELAEAVQVNPYDIEGSARTYHRAVTMPEAERRARMRSMRRCVFAYDVFRWSGAFLDQLARRTHFVLAWGAPVEEPLEPLCDRFLRATVAYWQTWVKHCSIPADHQDEVIRSALALRLHCFEDTGAIVAAMTTSIPESPGSGRTWD